MPTPSTHRLWKAVLVASICVFQPLQAVLAQEAPPAVPTNVQVVLVTLPGGSRGVQISWKDNSENELGFVVVDQETNRQYDPLPNPEGKGTRMSMTIPVEGGCFRMFAYNNYGASPLTDAVCASAPQPAGIGGQVALVVLAILFLVAIVLSVILVLRRRSIFPRPA
jgi:hypothetical protein